MEKRYFFIKIESVNKGDHFLNMNVIDKDKNRFNIKVDKKNNFKFEIEHLYWVEVIEKTDELRSKENYYLEDIKNIFDLEYEIDVIEKIILGFQEMDFSLEKNKLLLMDCIQKIENEILRKITFYLIEKYKYKFFVYPAASKFHHAYIGGLTKHTLGMIKLADIFLELYPNLSKSLVYSGIILHDLMKVEEYDGVINANFSKKGSLLGHISLGINEVNLAGHLYKCEDSEEVLMLEHILLSHHGQFIFGSPKKPQIIEAFIVNFIDTLDSKMTVISEELEKTKDLEFTDIIIVADKTSFYKHKVK